MNKHTQQIEDVEKRLHKELKKINKIPYFKSMMASSKLQEARKRYKNLKEEEEEHEEEPN